jgi:enoyl-CoA hydratase/carnithine racemase
MTDRVSVSRQDGVAEVRLNRPEKLNALDLAMFEGLVETGRALAGDASLRAVVLSGEGRAFCAGLDVACFAGLAQGSDAAGRLLGREPGAAANHAQQAAAVWTDLPVPVIAAVHGVAFGGGLQIALGADIRLVAPDAQLSVMEVRWGLVPDMTGSQTLRRLVRLDVAKELAFTGRIVTGTEAVALGLGTRVSEAPREAAWALAREIAARSPDAVRAAKRLLDQAGLVSREEGLRLEERIQRSLIRSTNQIEAVMANVEQRPPRFHDPA